MPHFIARQPIFSRSRSVVAYELLFRDGPRNFFPQVDHALATSRVVHDSLNVFGLHDLVGETRAYINVDRKTLLSGMLDLLPPARTTVEILETVAPAPDVVDACRALRAKGYEIALDDFVFAPGYEPLVALADVIKVDLRQTAGSERRHVVDRHARRGLRFLAEKVETTAELEETAALGYALFQGYFFSKPEMICANAIPAFKASRLRLLQLTTEAELDFRRVEEALRADAALSMRLLRYLDSAALGMRAKVTSIKHALTLLGERPLRRWITLATVTSLGEDRPPELVTTALVRARFCEAIGERWSRPAAEGELFLVGMLSLADAMMGRPMTEILGALAVTDRVRGALLGDGEMASVLRLAIAYEGGAWAEAHAEAARMGLGDGDASEAYEDAVAWARAMSEA
jgi:c-di-GMP-related signal transduction protein